MTISGRAFPTGTNRCHGNTLLFVDTISIPTRSALYASVSTSQHKYFIKRLSTRWKKVTTMVIPLLVHGQVPNFPSWAEWPSVETLKTVCHLNLMIALRYTWILAMVINLTSGGHFDTKGPERKSERPILRSIETSYKRNKLFTTFQGVWDRQFFQQPRLELVA